MKVIDSVGSSFQNNKADDCAHDDYNGSDERSDGTSSQNENLIRGRMS